MLKQLKKFEKCFQVSTFTTKLKNESEYAKYIQYPKIPSGLSESIVVHLITKNIILKKIANYEITLGGKVADIIAKNKKKTIKIEVKATGSSAFQYFGPKDIKADYLIWIHFGDLLRQNKFEGIKLFTISNPAQYFKQPQKITLKKMQEILRDNLETKILGKNSL